MAYYLHGAELQISGVDIGVEETQPQELDTVTIEIAHEEGECSEDGCASFCGEQMNHDTLTFSKGGSIYRQIIYNESFIFDGNEYSPCMYRILTRTKAEKKPRYFAIIKKVVTINI